MAQGLPAQGAQPPEDLNADGQSGQALLELALVVPILVLLVVAIFQFAIVLQTQVGLTNALREAARRVAALETDTDPAWMGWGPLQSWVQGELCGDAAAPCDAGLLTQNVQSFDGGKLWQDPPPVSFCWYSIDLAGTPTTQYQVQVDVRYKHPVFFGLMAFATDLVDGTPNGFWDLDATAQMRLENIDPTMPSFSAPATECPA